jgi:hypothetical protein
VLAQKDTRTSPRQMCDTLVNLGHQLEGRDRPLLGLEIYRASHRLDPSHGNTLGSLYKVNEWLCDWEARGGREAAFGELMALVRKQLGQAAPGADPSPKVAMMTSLQPLTALSQDVDVKTQLYIARAWAYAYTGGHDAVARGNKFLLGAKIAKAGCC